MKLDKKAIHEMKNQPLRHGPDNPLPPRWLRQIIDERMESFWEDFRRSAVLLNEAGQGPCQLIEVIEEMEESGDLISCGACSKAHSRL
jgi:hypothetical protein